MWKICICDDEKNTGTILKEKLQTVTKENFPDETFSYRYYESGKSFLWDIEDSKYVPDILFMDIDLGDENGIKCAEKTIEYLPYCQVIFISGYDKYYLDVYEVEHIYFLRKPFEDQLVLKALERAMTYGNKKKEKLFAFTLNSKLTVIPHDKILYFEKNKRKIIIYTVNNEQYEFYSKFEELRDKFKDDSFIRCHNSYVVNLNNVSELTKGGLIICDKTIPVSRHYSKEVKEKFMDYINESLR